MNHAAAIAWLGRIQGKGIKLGLENVTRLIEEMGRPQDSFPSLLVGGTNGKGSVCAFLASILDRAGYRTGLYTSPHLIRYEERIAVGGRPIAPPDFAAALTRVRDAAEDLLKRGGLASHPTHFEVLTAAALDHFRRSGVQAAVMEVGMGGRLDATRVVRAPVVAITSIGLEHTKFLGTTHEAIAAEKAGIIEPPREGGRAQRVVSGVAEKAAADVIRARAHTCGARLVEAERDAGIEASGGTITITTARARYGPLRLPLAGRHQRLNAAIAVLAAEAFDEVLREEHAARGIAPADIAAGLETARWPGRLQIVSRAPLVILDGAHNPAGCAALAVALADLRASEAPGRIHLVFGALEDKDAGAMLRALTPASDRIVLTRGRSPRFRDPGTLKDLMPPDGPEACVRQGLGSALAEARRGCGERDAVVVCGSLYLVGDTLQELGVEPFAAKDAAPCAG